MQFLQAAPRYLFFTGKGGVGKTSIACATAVHLAAQGKFLRGADAVLHSISRRLAVESPLDKVAPLLYNCD